MILSRFTDLRGRRVLDLGCNVGFYSFSLALRGAQVTSMDARREYVVLASDIARLYSLPMDFRQVQVLPEVIDGLEGSYDLALCFSMIQWVMASTDVETGKEVLRAISRKADALFFDVAVNEGKACLKSEPGEEIAYVARLLREATDYRRIDHIGTVYPYDGIGRSVFYCYGED